MIGSTTQYPERVPQALAEQLDRLAKQHADDSESYKVLTGARETLRVLAWNRYAARHMHADKVEVLCRRHKGRKIAQEGRIHA
jgi:hypothetical protein